MAIFDFPKMEKSSEKSVLRICTDNFAKYASFASSWGCTLERSCVRFYYGLDGDGFFLHWNATDL